MGRWEILPGRWLIRSCCSLLLLLVALLMRQKGYLGWQRLPACFQPTEKQQQMKKQQQEEKTAEALLEPAVPGCTLVNEVRDQAESVPEAL